MTNINLLYNQKLAAETIYPDADQLRAVRALEKLGRALVRSDAPGVWRRLRGKNAAEKQPQGCYLHGSVGRGKSMVMDMFFNAVGIEKKRRVHFHAFMLEVHDFLHAQRTGRTAQDRLESYLIACADKIARESRLLCFDEFQVGDVADAMILGRLFTALFERGVVLVMTSNIAPDDLYADGLQRDRFIPFIEMLKQRLDIIRFSGETDYRLNRLLEGQVYFHPHTEAVDRELDKIFQALAGDKAGEALDIPVKGRVIHVPRAAGEVVAFSFSELCEQPKSALDYLELARRFRVFIVKNVPRLTDAMPDDTARFITLVDTLYDRHAHLVISAAVPVELLYGGNAEAPGFARMVSRLMEMQSREYRSRK